MLILRDRIIDDGEKGFFFPIPVCPNLPRIDTLEDLDSNKERAFCSIMTIGKNLGYILPLSSYQEQEVLQIILTRAQSRSLHIIDWTARSIVDAMRTYYNTSIGFYDPVLKQSKSGEIPSLTIGVSLTTLCYSESDHRLHPGTGTHSPPIRTTLDRKGILAGVNEGIIAVVSSDGSENEDALREKVAFLIHGEYVSPFRLGQVLCYGYERIGYEKMNLQEISNVTVDLY